MKKIWLIICIMLIFNILIVVAQNSTNNSIANDASSINKVVKTIPIDESGKFDPGKLQPVESEASKRIDAINQWLDENVSWMKFIFNMKPQLSLLFFLNVYFILFFLVILVFNSKALWFFIEKKSLSALFGFSVFVALSATKLYIWLAEILSTWINYVIFVLFPSFFLLGIILIIVTVILAIISFPAVTAIASVIDRYFQSRKEFKEKIETSATIGAMDKLVEQITKD